MCSIIDIVKVPPFITYSYIECNQEKLANITFCKTKQMKNHGLASKIHFFNF